MAAKGRKLTIDDLTALHWIADPQISPDGTRVAFTRTWVDTEADEYRTAIWILDADGAGLRRLTAGERDTQPRPTAGASGSRAGPIPPSTFPTRRNPSTSLDG
jgi:dipeptidyl aminopeptidase/acylaminoacyl peptidase